MVGLTEYEEQWTNLNKPDDRIKNQDMYDRIKNLAAQYSKDKHIAELERIIAQKNHQIAELQMGIGALIEEAGLD